jgi:hypothetical protein
VQFSAIKSIPCFLGTSRSTVATAVSSSNKISLHFEQYREKILTADVTMYSSQYEHASHVAQQLCTI